MDSTARAVAIVGVGAILPDALNPAAFWQNIVNKRYSITETPPDRWCVQDYYDPDPTAPDKTYSKIGGWVRGYEFDWKKYRIPPRVAAAMDQSQQWAVTIADQALTDYGYPQRPLDTERTGVILGTAMGGEMHYITALRVFFPEFARALESVREFRDLSPELRDTILANCHQAMDRGLPPVTEDSMPGELANIVSGRVANVLNLRGPSFITDAACASSLAAMEAAVELLVQHHVDAVVTGGVDRNMGAPSFVKFCKIGALSATGTRPFGQGADGFVMGEGAAAFLLKRLEDAERAGDKIYAVIRGVGGASDGKGKGITAPNPIGQRLATQRAWENAGLDPATATLVEAHGTSTKVGDVVEVESLASVFGGAPRNAIGLGSVKSNFGHLKAGAGAAGLLKATLALHHKILPPTLHAERPNPDIDFDRTPFYLNHEAREWKPANGDPRRCGVSAYGFGGTNFHVVLEEHVPGRLTEKAVFAMGQARSVGDATTRSEGERESISSRSSVPPSPRAEHAPFRGMLAIGASTPKALKDKLDEVFERVQAGWTPPVEVPKADVIQAGERLIIDFGDHDELLDRIQKARKAMGFDTPPAWRALQQQGVFRGSGAKPGKIAFLFPGQGSQYVNMGRELAGLSPRVAQVLADADRVMTPVNGKPLTDFIFFDGQDPEAIKNAEKTLTRTEYCQPAMLTLDTAIYQLLGDYGFKPDMVMGHSLGEYAALIASGVMSFDDALRAAAARGTEMARVSMDDNGWMAAVMAPYEVVEQTLKELDGYVVAANINSQSQCVIGGASKAVEQAINIFNQKGFQAMRLPVSHAFHTKIVAPASDPLRAFLDRIEVRLPTLPMISNVTGDFYPKTVQEIKDALKLQIASPVQWVKGVETLYAAGARTFVEVGPKKALKGFVDDILGSKPDVVSLFSNHPKVGELPSFNQALCGLYAAGYGADGRRHTADEASISVVRPASSVVQAEVKEMVEVKQSSGNGKGSAPAVADALTELIAATVERMNSRPSSGAFDYERRQPYDRNAPPLGSVVITGTGLGLPGAEKPVMDPDNALRILRGEQFVDLIPERFRKRILAKRITRVVKGEDGSGRFEIINDADDVIKLAGRAGYFNLTEEYGVPEKLVEALDVTTQLAMAAGFDALREAGIPLVQTYKRATTGKYLPDRWLLPESLRDETGVIFASAFPGGDRYADEFTRYYTYQNRLDQVKMLEELRSCTADSQTLSEIARRLTELRVALEHEPYEFDRRFLFRVLSMGHSQFAEYIGARGPNTQVNAACASTAQAIALAEDWIQNGRVRRVIVVAADDVTSDNLLEWVGAGFLATGAAATDDRVEEAALPFDRRRHGTLMGMGACALVVESQDAVRERGMRGIVELLSSETNNSAFHGTRLDVDHIASVMNNLVTSAERRFGLNRYSIAPHTVFMSHETFTPARGGSASAEVVALRKTFGEAANEIIVANTKGFTGHPMGVGVEDVIAIKILEYGIVPPIPNYKEVDLDLGTLNFSRGGRYPVQYALHLAAGFGSQISMTLTRHIPGAQDRVDNKLLYQRWLADVSGYDRVETEVYKRVLRIKASGAPPRAPAPSVWQPGTGPVVRTGVENANGHFAQSPLAWQPPRPVPAQIVEPPLKSEPPRQVQAAPVKPVEAPPPRAKEKPPVERTVQAPPPAPKVQAAAPIQAKPESPPVPATASVPATAPAPVVKPAGDPIAEQVLKVVAAKTGYPREMLDLDLDLEADLGIDTVKQAETFAAIRETFNIARQDNLKLRDYPTLRRVVQFVRDNTTAPAAAPGPQVAAAPAPSVGAPVDKPADPIALRVMEIVAAKTGYPREMLDPDLDLEADLGIDTVKQAETFAAIREAFDIPRQENLKLRDYPTLKHVIGFVRQMKPELAAQTAEERATEDGARRTEEVPVLPQLAPAPSPISSQSSAATDSITDRVLQIVAAKTGYPREMLDLDLDLEADLGVDTVKQAETFAAIREAFDIPRQENLKLRDYPTLKHVIGFVRDMRPDLAVQPPVEESKMEEAQVSPQSAPAPSAVSGPSSGNADPITDRVLQIVAAKTGYPIEMLDLELDLEADLGVDTVKQAETFAAIREAFDIPRQENLKLRDYPTLKHVISFVRAMRPDLAVQAHAEEHKTEGASVTQQPAPAPAAVGGPSSAATDAITDRVLQIVAAKTGYPIEMLDLELDLEADLGVDTVKQAETFAAIREAFDIPRQENLKLRDYPTLKHVIGFVRQMKPELAAPGAAEGTSTAVMTAESPAHPHAPAPTPGLIEDANRIPRRVPVPVLRPALDLCKPTGIVLDESSRVVVMLDEGGIGIKLLEHLHKRGVTVLTLEPGLATEVLDARVKAWLSEGAIQGVYWLPALDVEPNIEELSLGQWHELNRVRVKNLYTAMRALYESAQFLVSATRLGGLHGYDANGATAPLGGAVVGFTKAYKRERGQVLVKTVDLALETAEPADLLLAETLSDPGVVEVGYREGARFSIALEEQPAANGGPGMTLDANTVFVVTGAAGGITSAIVSDLAAASGGSFYLLDLVPPPDPADSHIALFRQNKEALKQQLIQEAKDRGERPTPVQIDKQIMAIEREEAALRAIEAVEAAGGKAYYRSVNLLDGAAMGAVIDEIRQAYGRIDVVVHAGGLEISRTLPDKDPKQFDLVFDVKADGFFNILRAAKGMPIGATVAFSSVAGRFGNNGQTDYSAANDLLCKLTSSLRAWRPETRGIVVDWTAWGGIGMATRGSIPKIMEMAGIDMLPPECGVPTVRRELTSGDFRGEVVVAGRLGILTQEWDETGGLDCEKGAREISLRKLLMVGKVKSAKLYQGLEVETTLDPNVQPFLYDHAMDGTPLLPGVMGIETFAELASFLAPEYYVAAVENVQYQRPFKFHRMQPQTLHLYVTVQPSSGGGLYARTVLKSVTTFPRGEMPPQEKVHFTANVRLTRSTADKPIATPDTLDAPWKNKTVAQEAIYKLYFHGPAYQVLERVDVNGVKALGLMSDALPPNTNPAEVTSLMAPRLIELAFQTAGIWELEHKGVLALPLAVKGVHVYRQPEEAEGKRLYASIEAIDDGAQFNARVLDESGGVYLDLLGYRTVQLIG